jgi:hypothetical protein
MKISFIYLSFNVALIVRPRSCKKTSGFTTNYYLTVHEQAFLKKSPFFAASFLRMVLPYIV